MNPLVLFVPIAFAAFLYACVGHGGASAYLAILVLAGYARPEIASSVLVMNILVSGIAVARFKRAGHLDAKLAASFLVFSAPAAFAGGLVAVPPRIFGIVLGLALLAAAARLLLPEPHPREVALPSGARFWRSVAPLGVGLGLLSGLTGVGGGIYLSPILLLLGWKDVKATAGVSAAFIFVNSATSLAGRAARGDLPNAAFLPLLVAAVLGGALGARWGADRAAPTTLRRLLGAVLLLAAGKLLFA